MQKLPESFTVLETTQIFGVAADLVQQKSAFFGTPGPLALVFETAEDATAVRQQMHAAGWLQGATWIQGDLSDRSILSAEKDMRAALKNLA